MKTIKLKELGTFKNGLNFTNSEIINPCKILGVADFKDNIFPPYSKLKSVDEDVVPADSLLEENDIVFVRSNGNKNLVGRTLFIKNIHEKITFSGFCIRFRPTDERVSPAYIFYMLKTKFCKQQYSYSQQTNITNLSQDVLGNVEIPIFDNMNKNVELLLDVDAAINNNLNLMDDLDCYANAILDYSISEKYLNNKYDCLMKDLVEIDNGKEYANFATENGKYRYFTCSQDVLWCDDYAFDNSAIIVATHGDFHVEHFIGKFNAYFCNSILVPKNKKFYGLVYYSLCKYLPKLKKQSSGSVIKFIGNDDLLGLPLYIPENQAVMEQLNSVLEYKQSLINQNINYSEIKKNFNDIFLNGQVTFK